MSDNDQDILETVDLDADAGLEDFDSGSGKAGLADSWRGNPLVKIGVVVGGLAVLVGGFMLFGGESKPIAPSMVSGGNQSALKEAPGGKVSDLYAKAVNETNEASVDQALKTGTSSLPVPIGPSKGKVEVEASKESSEDPLERWRRIQEERTKKEQQAKVEPVAATTATAAPPPDPYAQQKQALSQSMAQQMQSILQAQDIKEPEGVKITDAAGWFDKRKKESEEASKVQAEVAAAAAITAATPAEILIEPGRIEYAQLIIEANSDVPGPVLAELASGTLVGNRMLGSFTKKDEFLVLTFDTVVVDGIGLSTTAIALDPETSRPGIVTDVDHKYFTRVILPAAAAFITGIGGAISESGSTTVAAGEGTVTTAKKDLDAKQEFFKGVEKASSKLGQVLEQDAGQTQIGVRVAAGTHIGVLFTKPVMKQTGDKAVMAPETQAAVPTTPQPILLQLQQAPPQAVVQQAVQSPSQPGGTSSEKQ